MTLLDGEILLFGCGGHSRSVADIVLSVNPNLSLIFVDENAHLDEKIYGFDVQRDYIVGSKQIFFAIGDNGKRKKKLQEIGMQNLITVIAPTSHKGQRSTIAKGCFVGNFCHIGPEVNIGINTIINNASIIEHEVMIGAHCHIGPNATISGRSKIGELVFVGVGASIKDGVSVCSNVMIGAGATVVNDINEPGTYVGTPARRIKCENL